MSTARIPNRPHMAEDQPRDAYQPIEVAARLGLGYDTIMRLVRDGKIKAVKLGRYYLIKPEEVDRLLSPPEAA